MYFKISGDKLITLLKNNHMLKALQQAGVDNWNWYGDALNNYLSFYKNIEIYDPDGELSDFDFEDLAYCDLDRYAEFPF